MNSKIIDGKKIASEIEEKLREKSKPILQKFIQKYGSEPVFVTFVDDKNEEANLYTKLKGDKLVSMGIYVNEIYLFEDTTFKKVKDRIEEENKDQKSVGIMIQLPLPKHLQKNQEELFKLINPKKDVDGLTDKGEYLPAVVKAVMVIVKRLESIDDKVFAVVGAKGWVGERILQALEFRTPGVIKIDEGDDLNVLQAVDVVISCVGKENLIKPSHIKDGAILIDVGLGDFDKECFEKASQYTEKRGGVGPLTIISLVENIIEATKKTLD